MKTHINKPIFAIGAGMQFLVYYCATGMLQTEVINGEEKGSGLNTIYEYADIIKEKLSNDQAEVGAGSIADLDPKIRLDHELFPNRNNIVFLDH